MGSVVIGEQVIDEVMSPVAGCFATFTSRATGSGIGERSGHRTPKRVYKVQSTDDSTFFRLGICNFHVLCKKSYTIHIYQGK